MTDPLLFRVPKRTYLNYLREANPAMLERAERVRLRDQEVWRVTKEAQVLDTLINKIVRLRSARTTNGGQPRLKGTPFLVIDAWLGRLHGIEPFVWKGKLSVPILLRPEWVSLDTETEFVVLGRRGPSVLAQACRDGDGVAESPPGPPP